MHMASVTQSETRLTIETMVKLANALGNGDLDTTRDTLVDAGFSGAEEASAASVHRVTERMVAILPLMTELPDLDVTAAARTINKHLTTLPISPAIVDHGGVGPHLHWTPAAATFDDQVLADVLMSLAHELCDNGTDRFGRCAATDCDDLFYDGTRNRSRRFCVNPRCASRTHTADHRARRRANDGGSSPKSGTP